MRRERLVALVATFLFLVALPWALWGPIQQAYEEHYADRYIITSAPPAQYK